MTVKIHPKPNWRTRYEVGRFFNEHLDHYRTLAEVAAELGISKQNAYTETVVALGTLVCAVMAKLGIHEVDISSERRIVPHETRRLDNGYQV